ncbi:TPA: siphovirus Gp157 family protein, partial [Streptococcus pyogenes]
MAYLYELEGIYAQLQSMDLDEETFQDTLDSIDFQADLENNIEYFVKMLKNAQADEEMYKAEKEAFYEKQKQAQAK